MELIPKTSSPMTEYHASFIDLCSDTDSGKRNQNTKEKAKRSRTHSDSDEFQAALFTSNSTKAPSDNCDSDWEEDSDFEKKRSNSKTKFSKASNIPLKRESNDSIEILSEEDSVSAMKAPQKGDEFPTLVDAQRFLDKFSAPMHFKFVIETGPHPNRGPNKDMIYRM